MIALLLVSQFAHSDAFHPTEAVDHERVAEIELNLSRLQLSLDQLTQTVMAQPSAPAEGGQSSVEQIQADLLAQGLLEASPAASGSVTIGVMNGRALKTVNSELYLGEKR